MQKLNVTVSRNRLDMRFILKYFIFVFIFTWGLALLDVGGFVKFDEYMTFGSIILTSDDFLEISVISIGMVLISLFFLSIGKRPKKRI